MSFRTERSVEKNLILKRDFSPAKAGFEMTVKVKIKNFIYPISI
jgi:hypothetical protein